MMGMFIMNKMFKLHILIFTITVLLCVAGISVSAAEYPDILRVGIYYDSGTVPSLTLESANGFTAGFTKDRSFYCLDSIDIPSVTITKAPSGTHHIVHSSHGSMEEMAAKLTELRAQGADVFPAYLNNSYCVLGGNFSSYAEAKESIDSKGISLTPIALSADALSLTDTATGKVLFAADYTGGNITVHNNDPQSPDSLLTISGSAKGTYRGGFECTASSGSSLTVVNVVPAEWYLYSVVGKEMSPSWHIEALKTQAVCARTFAMRKLNRHKDYGFDVCNTTCCQAYSAAADMSESVHTAVDETRGQLLFYNSQLAETVYSSSTGSSTEDSRNVWGGSVPYLVSVPNPYEDTENIYNGKWSNKLTTERATELMSSYGIGTVTDISAIEYSDAGRVIKLRVTGTEGEKIFERDKCRSVFGEATKSQKYTITKGGTVTYPVVYAATASLAVQKTLDDVSVCGGNGSVTKITGGITATNGTEEKCFSPSFTDGDPNTYTFTGEGWGHSVGMSQYGAKGMAEEGFSYEEILTHYYTGTNLKTAY